jgi:hypothetical protein
MWISFDWDQIVEETFANVLSHCSWLTIPTIHKENLK